MRTHAHKSIGRVIAIAHGAIQQIGNLSMDSATAHIAVLGHADVAVPKLVSADTC